MTYTQARCFAQLDEDHSVSSGDLIELARPGAASARGASDGAGGAAGFNHAEGRVFYA
ncbi:hypothetical protein [Lacticaseibacillus jixiensis]|uniref:hypothetical protein n=1 Tax=Lacticaseibacillus jixiensis TaxID=3231926 RepID=UPI0036F423D8